MCVFIATLFGWAIPLVATQLLWVNLITDTLPAISLGMDPGDKEVMERKPRNPKESFFSEGAGTRAIIGGVLIGVLTLLAFYLGIIHNGTVPISAVKESDKSVREILTYGRTMAFIVLTFSQLFYSLSMRNNKKTIFEVGFFGNKFLIGSIVIGIVLQMGLTSIPQIAKMFKVTAIDPSHWGMVIGLSLVPFVVNEVIKVVTRREK